MAKKPGVNKSQAVREYLKTHPKAKSNEIAEALTKAGTKITPGHVANIKSKAKKRRRARGKATRAVSASSGVGIPELKAALALLKFCGSAGAAKEALAAAEDIQKML